MKIDCLVVGAGFAGSVVAERVADAGYDVLVIDKRFHIGGNAYDVNDSNGVLIHKYGPHIFHTNSDRIFNYLSKFTTWRYYEHRVLSFVEGIYYPFPINLDTINLLYDTNLNEKGMSEYLDNVREVRDKILTSEDVVINSVGRDLYEKFFRGYTRKQWGVDPSELFSSVAARIPVRYNKDNRYFTDKYQTMPKLGYTSMFSRMLSHPNIHIETGVDFNELRYLIDANHTVYTGPIDEYFHYRLGKLPYRSLRFEHEHLADIEQYQQVGTINYPNDYLFTRITEFKHLTGQFHKGTSIVREYPQSNGDPYYPIPRNENEALYKQYEQLANDEINVTFVGRLAQYRYYNMDQVVGAALKASDTVIMQLKNRAICN